MRPLAAAALAAAMLLANAAPAQTLRIGLREDPDVLDPTLARTYVGRIVFASLCDKLFDIDEQLRIVPQLATGHEWSADSRALTIRLRPGVRFHDGEAMDAEAVKASLDRHLTLQGSFRRSEINVVQSVVVVDPLTVRLELSVPFAPLIAQLTDRAGMVMSPKALREAGAQFGSRPVCAGPFRFVERVAQDRIVLERFEGYWDRANIHVERVVFQPIQDTTVLLANLQAGQLDLVERVNPTDGAAIRRDRRLRLVGGDELGYNGITINVGNGERARSPLGQSAKVREALELSIDREVINQVVYAGEFVASAQWVPPNSPFFLKDLPMPARDVARARRGGHAQPGRQPHDPEQPGPAPGRRGDPVDGSRVGLRRPAAGHRVRLGAAGRRARGLRGLPRRLVGPQRPRRQHLFLRHLQGRAERRPLLRRRGRPAARRGARRARRGPAHRHLPQGRRALPRARPRAHLPLAPQEPLRAFRAAAGPAARARRADPPAGHQAAVRAAGRARRC
jgi:Bacterial extracellular solute-binding proteins, family 5 Middle